MRTFTLLDYLLRLRIKTSYEDAGMFIDGLTDHVSSQQVHRDLTARCTSLIWGNTWVTYWWTGGSFITSSEELQALARGDSR